MLPALLRSSYRGAEAAGRLAVPMVTVATLSHCYLEPSFTETLAIKKLLCRH